MAQRLRFRVKSPWSRVPFSAAMSVFLGKKNKSACVYNVSGHIKYSKWVQINPLSSTTTCLIARLQLLCGKQHCELNSRMKSLQHHCPYFCQECGGSALFYVIRMLSIFPRNNFLCVCVGKLSDSAGLFMQASTICGLRAFGFPVSRYPVVLLSQILLFLYRLDSRACSCCHAVYEDII